MNGEDKSDAMDKIEKDSTSINGINQDDDIIPFDTTLINPKIDGNINSIIG